MGIMMSEYTDDTGRLRGLKREIRAQATANLQQQRNKDELSERIHRRLMQLAEYAHAKAVLVYVSRSGEVQTRAIISQAWVDDKQVAVPCCVDNELELYRLKSMEDLVPRTLGILEPRNEVRCEKERKASVERIDLIIVPGVAFDRKGGRVGHGRGYYDRMLCRARPGTSVIGLAFECQIVPEVPMMEHDVFVHKVITEQAIYESPFSASARKDDLS
jgi:5-formyltetrahydrofolate cyclo-ligase